MLLVEFRVEVARIIYDQGMARSEDLQQKSRKSRTDLHRGNSLIFILSIIISIIIASNLFVQNSRSVGDDAIILLLITS